MHVTPSNFFSRVLRNEALGYKSYFFGTAILRKLFEIRFSYEHCNFARVCLLVKMASKTVTRGAIHSTKIQPSPTGKRGPPQKVDLFFRNFSGWTEPIHWVLDRNFRKFWLNGSRTRSILPRYHAERFHEIASACANQCNVCRRSDWLFIAVFEDFFQKYSSFIY